MQNDSEKLADALRRMPVPEPRPGFVDAALARATGSAPPGRPARHSGHMPRLVQFITRWETWAGAAVGACATALITLLMLRPAEHSLPPVGLALALHEARAIDVLIDSERDLEDATIRIAARGAVALDGFDDDREIDWQADLKRGSNLLSLPVVARTAGKGQLIATVEHEGRTRRVAIDLTVLDPEASRS